MLFRSLTLCLLAVFLTVNVGSAQVASLSLLPDGLSPGDQFRYVFVTDGTTDATSSDITEYDAFVTTDAEASGSLLAGLGLNFQVIGSTPVIDAKDHITGGFSDVPFVLVTGEVVSNTSADFFDGSFDVNLDVLPSGASVTDLVWTGSMANGLAFEDNELGTEFSDTVVASTDGGTDGLGAIFAFSKNDELRTFGISSVVTAVPEPSSLLMLGLVAFGLASRRRRYCVV